MNLKDIAKPVVEPAVGVNEVNRISSGTVIKGEISSEGDIRIDGRVDGKVYSKGKIVVGDKASLKGSMLCATADFWGTMDGDVYVKDLMSIKSSAIISGSVNVHRFEVEVGAKINGNCKMISPEEFDKSCESVVTTKIGKTAGPSKA